MPDGTEEKVIEARVLQSLDEIAPETWNALANPENRPKNPFVSHEFLSVMERSGSVSPEAGWMPHHLIVEENKSVIAALPLYVKSHSQGEYIFDHAWADAYERAGGRYYPKLLSAVPFTPVTGPRLLARDEQALSALIDTLKNLTERIGVSSLHINFPSGDEAAQLSDHGFLHRTGLQYHWKNQNYQCWDDFSATLSSRKRKALKKERACLAAHDLTITWVSGADINEQHLDIFWQFYQDTGARKWGQPYLTRAAFTQLAERMADQLLFVFANAGSNSIAGALNILGGDTLYGRYWGTTTYVPNLHFEVCYYQAIDYAIAHGLKTVEAGAQGEHKIARGYEPVTTHSAHYIVHDGLREAIDHYLNKERLAIEQEAKILSTFTPFKKGTR